MQNIEWLGLGDPKSLKDHLKIISFQTPFRGQRHLPLEQVAGPWIQFLPTFRGSWAHIPVLVEYALEYQVLQDRDSPFPSPFFGALHQNIHTLLNKGCDSGLSCSRQCPSGHNKQNQTVPLFHKTATDAKGCTFYTASREPL